MWNIPIQWVGGVAKFCWVLYSSVNFDPNTKVRDMRYTFWVSWMPIFPYIYRKDVRKVFYISVLGFFCYLNDLPCPFTFLGSTTMRRMSSYESSGVDFFLILFHQCSRLLQFALDDRRNKNFSGVGRMNVLLRQERYDVCRIHLNKEKKGSEKLFFFFRVWADAARPASLVTFSRIPLDDDTFFVVAQYNSNNTAAEGGKKKKLL